MSKESARVHYQRHRAEVLARTTLWSKEHKDKVQEIQRKYRDRHRAELNQRAEEYRMKNPELVRERVKRYRIKHRDRVLAGAARYRANNRERVRAATAKWKAEHPRERMDAKLQQRYGMSLNEYENRLGEQHGVCLICQEPPVEGKRLSVDHDHVTGKVRGLLCGRCNRLLPIVESPLLLSRAIAYLDGTL